MVDRTGAKIAGSYQGRKFCGYVMKSQESKIWKDTTHLVELESWIEINNVCISKLNLSESEIKIIQNH